MRRVVALCVLLAACSHQQGTNFEPQAAEQIRLGTPNATVERLWGAPHTRNIRGAEETWVYSHMAMDNKKAIGAGMLAVPIVGPLVYLGTGAYDPNTNTEMKEATIVFKNGVVTSCKIRLTTLTEAGGMTNQEAACGAR